MPLLNAGPSGIPGVRLYARVDVRRWLSMEQSIAAMQAMNLALQTQPEAEQERCTPLRQVLRLSAATAAPRFFGLMPSQELTGEGVGAFGCKCLSVFPGAPAGQPSHQGAYLLFSASHMGLEAIIDAEELTALRTAANTAVAVRALLVGPNALPFGAEPVSLGIVGTGEQARRHALALSLALRATARPLRRVLICGRDPGRTARCVADILGLLATEMSTSPIEVAAASLDDALARVDVLCTVTAARTPVVCAGNALQRRLATGHPLLVCAIGACTADAREIDGAVVGQAARAAPILVDQPTAAIREAGDLVCAAAEGYFVPRTPRQCVLPLPQFMAQGMPEGTPSTPALMLYKSVGFGLQDLTLARRLNESATGASLPNIALGGGAAGVR